MRRNGSNNEKDKDENRITSKKKGKSGTTSSYVFIMAEDDNNKRNNNNNNTSNNNNYYKFKIYDVKHPKTNKNVKMIGKEDGSVLEISKCNLNEGYSSWFVGDFVYGENCLYLATPLDPLFFILPKLRKSQQKSEDKPSGVFCTIDDILNDMPSILMRASVERGLIDSICECKPHPMQENDMLYRLNDDKLLSWLKAKVLAVYHHIQHMNEIKNLGKSHASTFILPQSDNNNNDSKPVVGQIDNNNNKNNKNKNYDRADNDDDDDDDDDDKKQSGRKRKEPEEIKGNHNSNESCNDQDLDVDAVKYSLSIVFEYLSNDEPCLEKLYQSLGLDKTKDNVETLNNIKPQQSGVAASTPTKGEENGILNKLFEETTSPDKKLTPSPSKNNNNNNNSNSKLSLSQKQLQKIDKKGMSPITSFFSAKKLKSDEEKEK